MDMRKAFPGNFIKAGDIAGEAKVITITTVAMEKVGDDVKPVLSFEGSEQKLVLNLTNSNTISDMLGYDSGDWSGKRVELYSTKTQFGSKMVDAIRVRPVGGDDCPL